MIKDFLTEYERKNYKNCNISVDDDGFYVVTGGWVDHDTMVYKGKSLHNALIEAWAWADRNGNGVDLVTADDDVRELIGSLKHCLITTHSTGYCVYYSSGTRQKVVYMGRDLSEAFKQAVLWSDSINGKSFITITKYLKNMQDVKEEMAKNKILM